MHIEVDRVGLNRCSQGLPGYIDPSDGGMHTHRQAWQCHSMPMRSMPSRVRVEWVRIESTISNYSCSGPNPGRCPIDVRDLIYPTCASWLRTLLLFSGRHFKLSLALSFVSHPQIKVHTSWYRWRGIRQTCSHLILPSHGSPSDILQTKSPIPVIRPTSNNGKHNLDLPVTLENFRPTCLSPQGKLPRPRPSKLPSVPRATL